VFAGLDHGVRELLREVLDEGMLIGRSDAIGLFKEPMPIEASTTVDNEARWGWQRGKKVEGLLIGLGQCACGMLSIGEVEVKPESRDNVGTVVGAAARVAWETVGPLEYDSKVHRVLRA